MTGKKLAPAKMQFFRPEPKHLRRMLKTTPKLPGVHPTRKDIENMAGDTIKLAPKFISDNAKRQKQIEDAKRTIRDVQGSRPARGRKR